MSLFTAALTRQLKHRRPIDVPVFARDDGPCEPGVCAAPPFPLRRRALRLGGRAAREFKPRGCRPVAAAAAPDS